MKKVTGNEEKKTYCLLTHLTVVTPAQTGNTIGSFKEHFELMKR